MFSKNNQSKHVFIVFVSKKIINELKNNIKQPLDFPVMQRGHVCFFPAALRWAQTRARVFLPSRIKVGPTW